MTEFGKLIRNMRIVNGHVLYDMANKLGYTTSFLSGIEHGRHAIPDDMIHRMQELYDLPDMFVRMLRLTAKQHEIERGQVVPFRSWKEPLE